MVKFFDDVQERAAAQLADIASGLILGPPGADVKLIDDEIVEFGRLPGFVAPGIALRIANDAGAVGEGGRQAELARSRA
jgi:hypothetical protein